MKNRIKELRYKSGIYSQIELANMVGVSKQTLSTWDNNKVQPNTANLMKLSKIFGCDVEEIVTKQ